MRIKWSSDAAEEMIRLLRDPEQGLEDCLRQAAAAREALMDADPEGDDQAVKKAIARLDGYTGELRKLHEQVRGYRDAIRRTDEAFSDAEAQIGKSAEAMEASRKQMYDEPAWKEYQPVAWTAESFGIIPNPRVRPVATLGWLEELTNHWNPTELFFVAE